MEKAKKGEKFIKPGSDKVYVVSKVVLNGGWVVLKEEHGNHQILTSQESLKTWTKCEKNQGR